MRVTYRNEILMPDSPFACKIDIAGVSTCAQSIMYCNVLALSLAPSPSLSLAPLAPLSKYIQISKQREFLFQRQKQNQSMMQYCSMKHRVAFLSSLHAAINIDAVIPISKPSNR